MACGSQVDGLPKDVLVAFFQSAGGYDIDGVAEEFFEFPGHPHKVEEGTVLAEVDQEVDIAVRAVTGFSAWTSASLGEAVVLHGFEAEFGAEPGGVDRPSAALCGER